MKPAAQWLWKRRLETPVTASTESRVPLASTPATLIAVRAIASELCCAEFNRWFLETEEGKLGTEEGKPVGLPHKNRNDLSHFGISHSPMVSNFFADGPSYSDRIAEALGRSRQVKRHFKNTF